MPARLLRLLPRHQRRLLSVLSALLFLAALWALHQDLAQTHIADIRAAWDRLPASHLLLAAMATLGSYLALTGYDVLALRHLGRRLPYPRVALISFIATAVGHNLGMAVLSAGVIRMRFYMASGLSALEITGLTSLIGLTFGVGATFACGLAMLLEPAEASLLFRIPEGGVRLAGALLVCSIAAYLAYTLVRRRAIRLFHWRFHLPDTDVAAGQLFLAGLDLSFAAAALYWLLPAEARISFPVFLSVYVLAVLAGILSHVPAGLGVFESVVLLALPDLPRDGLLAAILAYRAIYYLAPLGLAALLVALSLLRERRRNITQGLEQARGLFAWLAPTTASVSVFMTGTVLLFSSSTPALSERMALLRQFVPLPLLELSHMAGSVAGLGLLILAGALRRRVDAAYHLAFWLLAAGAAASLIKGLDYEEAILSGVALGILWLGRSAFNRPAALLKHCHARGWMPAVLAVLTTTVWLGLFSYKHVAYSQDLWWQFAFRADAPRFLRASLVLALLLLGLGLMRLLRPPPPRPIPASEAELEQAAAIVAREPETWPALALLGDKHLLFNTRGNAFLMYRIRGHSWVALGDPVGPAPAREELAWRFRELADLHGGRAVFYQVHADSLPIYLDMGLSAIKLGEEAVVPLPGFSLEGPGRRALRQSLHRAQREGLGFELAAPASVPWLMPELRRISNAWLAEKHTREKGFALGYFRPDYLVRFPCALVRQNGRIIAFANVLTGADRHELSVDMMRHTPEAPRVVMDYLFLELMQWGAREGYTRFNLGMAPLAGLETHPLAPLWHRVGTLIFQQGEHFYNFEGLRAYKNKFDPVWQPKYMAAPGGLALPAILADVTTLIAGGLKGVLSR